MISIKKTILISSMMSLISLLSLPISHSSATEDLEEFGSSGPSTPRSPVFAGAEEEMASRKFGRRPHLTRNQGAAIRNTWSFINPWNTQFEAAQDASQQRAILRTILEESQKELHRIIKGPLPEDVPSSPLSPEDLIRQAMQKRRFLLEVGEEDPTHLFIKGHQQALQTTPDEQLLSVGGKILNDLYDYLYKASLTRLNVESWARSQIFCPHSLSFRTAEEVLFPAAERADSFEDKMERVSTALREVIVATQSLKAHLHEDDSLIMSAEALDLYMASLTDSWVSAFDKGEELDILTLQMKGSLEDAITGYETLVTHWKRIQEHTLSLQTDSEDERKEEEYDVV